MMNGRPVSMRKKVQLMVALTILAWATQTLFQQWGYGQAVSAQAVSAQPAAAPAEKFVPGTARFAAGATLELRGEATIIGPEVKLRQVCRWSGADAGVFAPVADLVLARIPSDTPFQPLSLQQVRTTLRDAGVNLAVVKFAGPTSCTVTRSDVEYDEQEALLQWANAREGVANEPAAKGKPWPAPEGEPVSTTTSARGNALPFADEPPTETPTAPPEERSPVRTLRDLIVEDLSVRLRVPADQVQIVFDPRDEQALRLAEPQFKFGLTPKRVRNLGGVAYDVQVITAAGRSKKIDIVATARAWQQQVVLARPVSFKQSIRESDVEHRRVLVDSLDDDPLLTAQQVVGQQAARELRAGTVLTAKMVQSMPLARSGQFITVTLNRGGVRVKTVGRAMGEGSYGQTIKVKNEATRDVYEVVLTGPQEATMGPAVEAADRADIASARVD